MIQKGVEFFHDLLVSTAGIESYGLAIIILTIVIKMVMYPLTVKQIKSMKAMQELQPEMKRLQQTYQGDPARLQAELSKLYQEKGVSPLSGCLPMLVQMPILMAIYYALRDTTYQGGNPAFLWMPTLSEPDPYYILPILSMATTFLVQQQTTGDNNNQQMKMMMYIMPLFIGWMSTNFAAGLVLYWVTMNIVQIGQQWWMFRNEEKSGSKPAAKESKKKDKKGKKGAF
ncbi:MAG: YidC/Oxa1 family membrane protein insertase [Schwartzia sp.]|nr:YidC/Oxa1 family membrane protein insertase [Schwartzia sp. (in: firmicutes)]